MLPNQQHQKKVCMMYSLADMGLLQLGQTRHLTDQYAQSQAYLAPGFLNQHPNLIRQALQ